MAGGKETPRQKMIGMMYLVLTALLALNVSKSILDAFVAIEENTQKANIVQVDRGNGFVGDVKGELVASKGEDQAAKRKKLEYVLKQMELIDKEAEKMIKQIDEIKLDILAKSGEAGIEPAVYKDKEEESILWLKGDGVKPIRMNLMAVQAKDQYDIPMHEIIGEDIKNPTGTGKKLWEDFNNYRSKIVELTGSYTWGEGSKFSITPKKINDYKDNQDLAKKVAAMVDGSKANVKEDRQVLIDLYMMLTKKETNKVHDLEGVHWIGMTFDHSPLVAAVASLSSMQQDVLSARAMALNHWKGKVSTGEYSFNKIMPLAYGQPIANSGDSVYLRVMMAAFDSDNQPMVQVLEGAEAEIKYPGNGQGIVGFKVAGGAEQVVKGTVSIKNKSGLKKTEPWEYTVKIMKPSGAISLPELNVLYRGYANKVSAVASGFDQTNLSASGASLSKSGEFWIASPGSGKEATLTVSGKNSVTGKSSTLLSQKFRVMQLPNPELYWGGSAPGGKGSTASSKLFAKYGPGIPLDAKFTITSWECQVPGSVGKPPTGSGDNIATAIPLLRQAKVGMSASFTCKVVGPDRTTRIITGSYKL